MDTGRREWSYRKRKSKKSQVKGLQNEGAASPWFRGILITTEYCCSICGTTLNL